MHTLQLKQKAVSTVQKQLEDSFNSMSDAISNLGIKVDIKAY